MLDIRNCAIPALGLALAAALLWGGGQTLRLAGERTDHATTKTQHAEVLRDLAERTARSAGAALEAHQAQQKLFAAIDRATTKEKTDALADNERRRAADTAGTQRLRIAAVCPAPAAAPSVPSTTPGPSVDPGTVEIAPEVRRAIWDFRAELIGDLAKLEQLQMREEAKPK